MSQENVEFARSVFSRWNAGERRFPDEEIHPDVVIVSRILGKACAAEQASAPTFGRSTSSSTSGQWQSRIGATRVIASQRWAMSVSTAGGAASRSINQLGFSLRSEAASCFASKPSLTSRPML
jgi:hypothetical protein